MMWATSKTNFENDSHDWFKYIQINFVYLSEAEKESERNSKIARRGTILHRFKNYDSWVGHSVYVYKVTTLI